MFYIPTLCVGSQSHAIQKALIPQQRNEGSEFIHWGSHTLLHSSTFRKPYDAEFAGAAMCGDDATGLDPADF